MKRLVIASTVLLLAACTSPSTQTPNSSSPGTAQGIEVSAPMPGSIVTSPLAVKGKATGNWFFEASMPTLLTDASGDFRFTNRPWKTAKRLSLQRKK